MNISINPKLTPTEYELHPISFKTAWEFNRVNNLQRVAVTNQLQDIYLCRENNPFFQLFYTAYAKHLCISLSPDDLWFQIISQVNLAFGEKEAEALREKFVAHQGKKKIELELPSIELATVLPEFEKALRAHLKPGVADAHIKRFSTTTAVDYYAETVALMSSCRHFFEYAISVTCGIKDIELRGTLEDWLQLQEAVNALHKFYQSVKAPKIDEYDWFADESSIDTWFNDGVIEIVDKFVQLRKGEVDRDFWNRVIRADAGTLPTEAGAIYGGPVNEITGWIRLLFYQGRKRNHSYWTPDSFVKCVVRTPLSIKHCDNIMEAELLALHLGAHLEIRDSTHHYLSLVRSVGLACDARINWSDFGPI